MEGYGGALLGVRMRVCTLEGSLFRGLCFGTVGSSVGGRGFALRSLGSGHGERDEDEEDDDEQAKAKLGAYSAQLSCIATQS